MNFAKEIFHPISAFSAKPASATKREFSHIRLLILLTTALNTLDIKSSVNITTSAYFQDDVIYCPQCFVSQIKECHQFMKDISVDDSLSIWQLLSVFPQRSCKRRNQFVTLKSSQIKVIAKYLAATKEHLKWSPKDREELQHMFLNHERLTGLQFYPKEGIAEFVDMLQNFHNTLPKETLWLYLLVNSQPLLMPILDKLELPVPKTYGICGFTFYQEYAGLDLYNYYSRDFVTKVKIAKQLVAAAVKFSYGFQKYRLYITDLTADNVVYDVMHNRLAFIDLDSLFVVDSSKAKYTQSTHKHEYIDCPGCFAYSPEDIAAYNVSDINIYSACQFLREDLYRDKSKGFLQPIPEEISKDYPLLMELLNKCVDCPHGHCWQRFSVASDLDALFEKILHDLK